MTAILRRARGFALVLALFLIVSIAGIALFLLAVSNVQVETGVMDEQAARAYQAARAGLDWGAYRVLRDGVCPAGTTTIPLFGFNAQVTCTSIGSESEGGSPVNMYRIVSTGCNASPCGTPTAGYVERQLQLTVAN